MGEGLAKVAIDEMELGRVSTETLNKPGLRGGGGRSVDGGMMIAQHNASLSTNSQAAFGHSLYGLSYFLICGNNF